MNNFTEYVPETSLSPLSSGQKFAISLVAAVAVGFFCTIILKSRGDSSGSKYSSLARNARNARNARDTCSNGISHVNGDQRTQARRVFLADINGDGIQDILTQWSDGVIDYTDGNYNQYTTAIMVHPYIKKSAFCGEYYSESPIDESQLEKVLREKFHVKYDY